MTKAQPPVIRQFFIDDAGGDKLLIKSNDKTIVVYLILQAESRQRKIGVVTKSTKTIYIRRVRVEHLFRQINGYGFCDYILRNQTSFDTVDLFDGIEHWKIPLKFIIDSGKILNFAQQGFERQIFVTLEQIEKFKILQNQNRRL
jgi:hypothetical protein